MSNGRKIYGFEDVKDMAFSKREEAEKYSKIYYNGVLNIKEISVFDSVDDFEKDMPNAHLKRLCKEKGKLLTSALPYPLTIIDKNGTTTRRNLSFTFAKEVLEKVDAKLREDWTTSQEVDTEIIEKVKIDDLIVLASIEEFRFVYDYFTTICRKVNDINNQIKGILKDGKVEKGKYWTYQQVGAIPDEYQNENPLTYEFEMLDKNAVKDYILLE